MGYEKTTWTNGETAITADRLNNLESQYDAVASDITDSSTDLGASLNSTIVLDARNLVD